MTLLNRLVRNRQLGSLNSLLKSRNKLKSINSSLKREYSNEAGAGLRVIFFGSDYFSVRVLRALKSLADQRKIQELAVVTSVKASLLKDSQIDHDGQDQVLDVCFKESIKYHLWSEINKNDDFLKVLNGFDVGVLASFGHLIPAKLINLFPQ